MRSTILSFVINFMKTCSWKSLTKNRVKGHIYLDKSVTGSIYVIMIPGEDPKHDLGGSGEALGG